MKKKAFSPVPVEDLVRPGKISQAGLRRRLEAMAVVQRVEVPMGMMLTMTTEHTRRTCFRMNGQIVALLWRCYCCVYLSDLGLILWAYAREGCGLAQTCELSCNSLLFPKENSILMH